MTVSTINIVGQVLPPTGVPDTRSRVFFVMTGYDTDADDDAVIYPVPGKDDEDGFPIAADGTIDVDLWPNQEGERNTLYRVEVQVHQLNRPVRVPIASISVPNTGGPYNLNDLLGVEPPPDATVEEYIAQLAAAVAASESAADSAAVDAAAAEASAAAAATFDPALYLPKAGNLAGLADAPTARTNLGLGSAATANTGDFATAAQGTLADNALPASEKADQATAEAGVDNTKYMTALGTKQAIEVRQATSGPHAIVTGGQVVIAHGLSSVPRFISYKLKCLTSEAGYSVGETLLVDFSPVAIGSVRANTAKVDGTNITIRYSSATTCFAVGNEATGNATALTNVNWELYVEAMI